MNRYKCNTVINTGHGMESVTFVIKTDTRKEAKDCFIRAMEQIGFDRKDYGFVYVTEF